MDNQQTSLALGKQPTLGTPEIDMHALIDEHKNASAYVNTYTRDFRYLDDLVDAIPLNKDPDAPYVGDTTLAGLVRSIPRNSLQQLPVFSVAVNGTKNSIAALVCTYLLKQTAFNEDTFGKGLLSTLQIGTEQALGHGYAPFMVATGQMYNDFGTSMRLLHYSDTAPEPGISDGNESGYHYVVAHLAPSRVRKILKAAQNNPNTSWDVKMLQRLLETSPKPTNYSIYESAARQNKPGEDFGPTYEIVTRYETGPEGTIITFCADVEEGPLRTLDNQSKWGYPRVMYLVIGPAALHPFGISRVRLASPNQNLMNIYYGNIAAMLLLNSKPPIFKRGRFIKPVQLKQGAVWESTDANASAELKTLDNGALQSFVEMAQQFAAQIQNIMGGQTNMTNSTNKAGFGKTGPGVQETRATMDINTNQITKILENFLRQYALVALDTLLSEQEGEDKLIVDDDTKNSINELAPATIGDDNKLLINWQRFYQAIEQWNVDIDVSLTPDEMKDKKRADLQDMLVVLAQNAQELGPQAVQKVEEITNMLLADEAPLIKPLDPNAPPAAPTVPPPHVSLTGKLDPAANAMAERAASLAQQ